MCIVVIWCPVCDVTKFEINLSINKKSGQQCKYLKNIKNFKAKRFSSFLNYPKYFRHVQYLKHYLYLILFSAFICGKFNSSFYVQFQLFLICKLYKSGLKGIHLIQEYFKFLDSVDIGGQQWHILKGEFQPLVTFAAIYLLIFISLTKSTSLPPTIYLLQQIFQLLK